MGLSNQFDPEAVERHQGFLGTQHDRTGDEMWVVEEDYDKLLDLYKKILKYAVSLENSYMDDHPNYEPIMRGFPCQP